VRTASAWLRGQWIRKQNKIQSPSSDSAAFMSWSTSCFYGGIARGVFPDLSVIKLLLH
jgi:hypothetical protein